jgi:hypothetical protein
MRAGPRVGRAGGGEYQGEAGWDKHLEAPDPAGERPFAMVPLLRRQLKFPNLAHADSA